MAQTFYAEDTTQTVATELTRLFTNCEALRSSFSGSSAPSSPSVVNGQLWLDTSATPHIWKVYGDFDGGGAAWKEVGSFMHSTLDLLDNTLKAARHENLGSHKTPAAGNVGEIYQHTGALKFFGVVSSSEKEVFFSGNNTDYWSIFVPAAAMERDGTNPPTAATKGTTPTLRGWLFDAANELVSFAVRVPAGYSADADCKLRLHCVLNQAESSGDDIDWTANLVTVEPASTEVASKTSTAATVAQDMSTFVSDGAVHAVDITLDFDDADNPIAPGDLLVIEIHRTDLANCGGVILVGAQVLFPIGTKVTE